DYFSLLHYSSLIHHIGAFFPSENIKVLLYEDLRKNSETVVEEIYTLLKVTPSVKLERQKANVGILDYQVKWISGLNRIIPKSNIYIIKKFRQYLMRFLLNIVPETES